VDLLEPSAAGLVQRSGLDLLQQLPDHPADPHDLGGLLHHLGDRPVLALTGFVPGSDRNTVGADHHDLRVLGGFGAWGLVHGLSSLTR